MPKFVSKYLENWLRSNTSLFGFSYSKVTLCNMIPIFENYKPDIPKPEVVFSTFYSYYSCLIIKLNLYALFSKIASS